jgi:predicted DCC family thiol-disulfide oxidoreductase YuxK
VVKGMEAVRQAYQTVGLGWILAPTRLPGLNLVSDLLYSWFARNRGTLGRILQLKCGDDQCALKPVSEQSSRS